MNWVDLRLRWPYYLLILMSTFFTYYNSNFTNSTLFILALTFILFRSLIKYYIPIQKPWKFYLILAAIFVFYLRLNANSLLDLKDDYFFNVVSLHCLSCIFVLLLRDPRKFDSSYIFVFIFMLMVSGSYETDLKSYQYAIQIYLIASLAIFIAIKYAPSPKKKYIFRRFFWYLFTLALILTISEIFIMNNSRIDNYLNRFTKYNPITNKDTMSISSMEKSWSDNDEFNKVVLRAYSQVAPKHLRISTFDTFKNKEWSNTINENEIKLDSIKIDDDYITRLYSSDRPDLNKPDATVYLSMIASGQLLITDKTTWVKTSLSLKKIEGNGYISSYAGRSGYSLYYSKRRLPETSNILNYYRTDQLNLSKDENDYINDLSNSITKVSDSTIAKVTKIHQYLIANHAYEISPKIPKKEHPVLYFLKNKVDAHCQYFSSASVFLLRAQNIPCRIASGYLCMRYNTVGDYWVSKGIDSHAWVEYFDNGWKTFDPTEGARITDETKLFLKNFAGTYDYLDFKVTLWAWQILSGEFKEYLGRKWDNFIDLILENVNLIYFLALASLSYIFYVKFFRKNSAINGLLLIYAPPNANKKQLVKTYLKIIQTLKNKNINIDGKDTIADLIKKIMQSDLKKETKNRFIETLNTYQMNRFKPDST